jgi:hypothetical protein
MNTFGIRRIIAESGEQVKISQKRNEADFPETNNRYHEAEQPRKLSVKKGFFINEYITKRICHIFTGL